MKIVNVVSIAQIKGNRSPSEIQEGVWGRGFGEHSLPLLHENFC